VTHRSAQMSEEFGKTIAAAYAAAGPTVDLGRGVHDGALAPEAVVQILSG
jgi:hypothetical protein